jgi:transposase
VARRKYDREFKQNAVELLLSSGKDLKPLAQELGICPSTLREWRDRYLRELEEPSDGSVGELTPREMADELRRLRKENETLKRQREILKKALGILSEQPPRGMP